MAVDPYEQYKNAYTAQQNAVNAANNAQLLERQNRERQAQQNLAAGNRTVTNTYKNAVNPYGSAASQTNGMSSAVTDYRNNAAYGNYLKGLGANQQNYTEAMNNSNTLWNNWLAQRAGQEADIEGNYADKLVAQGNTDREFDESKRRYDTDDAFRNAQLDWQKSTDERDYNRGVFESDRNYDWNKYTYNTDNDFRNKQFDWQKSTDERDYNRNVLESDRNYNRGVLESDRDYNRRVLENDRDYDRGVLESDRAYNRGVLESDRAYNYQVKRDEVGDSQWDKEFKEDVRQFDLNYALNKQAAGGYGGSGGSSGGGNNNKKKSSNDSPTDLKVPDNPSPTVARSYYEPSSVPGYQYRIFVYNDGSTSKVMVKK